MPSVLNHTMMIGPKKPPTPPVPRRCSMNSTISSPSANGTTYGSSAGVATLRPSTALSTEIDGVSTPSP